MKKLMMILWCLTMVCRMSAKDGRDSLDCRGAVYDNPALLLRGQVSGVRVAATDGAGGGLLNTYIRGVNGLRGNSEPLWVVDGTVLSSSTGQQIFPFWQYGDMGYSTQISQTAGIDLNNIESIKVIKNASMAGEYGSRAANGVILVTTKKAEEERFSIDWTSNIGVSVPSVSSEWFMPGFAHNHSLSFSDRKGRTNYRVSMFFRDVDGIVSRTGNQVMGLRAKFETRANNVVWFGLNTAISYSDISAASGTSWYGAPSLMLSLRGILPLPYFTDQDRNTPQGWLNDYDDKSTNLRTTDSFYLDLNFLPWLTWSNRIGFDCQSNTRSLWYGNGTSFGYAENGAAAISYVSLFSMDYVSELKLHRYFANNHCLSASLMFDYSADWNKFNNMNGTYFVIHTLRAKGLQLMQSAAKIRRFTRELYELEGRANLAYDWKHIMGVELSADLVTVPRYDMKLNYDDNIFTAANIYVDLRKIFTIELMSEWKLRAGYGEAGNRRAVPYEMIKYNTGGSYPIVESDLQAFYEGFNRFKTSEYNASVDFGFAQGRYSLSLGFYHRSTSDKLDIYSFGRESSVNAGKWIKSSAERVLSQSSVIANTGLELDFSLTPVKISKVNWTVWGNAAYNINHIASLSPEDGRGLSINRCFLQPNINVQGQPVAQIYGYKLDETNTVTGEGVLGNVIPVVNAGLGTFLNLYGFTLSLQFDGAFGFNILNMNRMLASGQEYVSEAFVERGDFVRMADMNLGYDIPMKNKIIRRLSVHAAISNLAVFSRYGGWNPDVNSFGFANMNYGIDYGSHPFTRNVMVGVTVSF